MMAAQGVFSRLDLLQALVLRAELPALELPSPADVLPLVYVRESREAPAVLFVPPDTRPPQATVRSAVTFRPPLRMPLGWRAERVSQATEAVQDDAPDLPLIGPTPKRSTEAQSLTLQDQVDAPPPEHRTRATLRAALCAQPRWHGRIDWHGVVQRLAQGRQLDQLPRVARPQCPGHLHLVLDDRAESLRSLVYDMRHWWRRLARVVGESRLVVHRLEATLAGLSGSQVPGFDSVGHRWLVLSDGRITDPEQRQRMADWILALQHRQHEVVMLAPVPAAALPCLPAGTWAVAWQGGVQVNAGGARSLSLLAHLPGVAEVLALMTLIGQVSTLLLRGLCQLVAGPGAVGLEWAVWNHPNVSRSGHHVEVQADHLEAHRHHLCTLPQDLLMRALALQRTFQWGLPDADLHLVSLRAARLAPQVAGLLADDVAAARQFLAVMAREGGRMQGRARLDWSLRAERLIDKTPNAVRVAERETFDRLAAEARRGRHGAPTALAPAWVKVGAEGLRLDRVADRLGALLLPEPVLAKEVLADPHVVALLGKWEVLDIGLTQEMVRVMSVDRPRWAESFAQTDQGLQALIQLPNGQAIAIDPASQYEQNLFGAENDLGFRWTLCLDKYGPRLVLSLTIRETEHRRSMRPLTFRYIPPGTFLMGSPEGVGDDDEHPQHPVILTEGFWLADTPCTQAQWQAVMGGNPSRVKDGPEALNRPVEQVNVSDVEEFLNRLQDMLPEGCEAVLPTEAQWEYAVRAGTVTAYWWGDEPDDNRANWDGQHDGTTPVDRYPPNPWGLHDMHGNVLEWCTDDQRTYKKRVELDPKGSIGGDARVVRGGSWFYLPVNACSAYRGWRPLDSRLRDQGFRLALRSSSPAPGGRATGAGRPGAGGASRKDETVDWGVEIVDRYRGAPRKRKRGTKRR